MSPHASTASPVRNGRTSTRALRDRERAEHHERHGHDVPRVADEPVEPSPSQPPT